MSDQMYQLMIIFMVIVIGCFVGKIKMFGVSLDIAGVLVVSIVAGIMFNKTFDMHTYDALQFKTNMKFISSLGSSIFVPAIGLSAGYAVKGNLKRGLKYAIMGSFMVLGAYVAMNFIALVDGGANYSALLGVFCGALTTTPGLAAACELEVITSSKTVAGYSVAYLIGVVFTVITAQILAVESVACDAGAQKRTIAKKESFFSLVLQLMGVAIIGSVIGNIKIPLLGISLGTTGGMLCTGILVGRAVSNWAEKSKISDNSINLCRNIGLALFFVGTGFPNGMNFLNEFSVSYIVYGAVLAFVPMVMIIISSCLTNKRELCSSIVSGGMTSTPSLGVLLTQNKFVDFEAYSLSYAGALITTIVLIRCFTSIAI